MNSFIPFVYLLESLTFFINLEPFILFILTALIVVTIITKALAKIEGPENIESLISQRTAEIFINSLIMMLFPLYTPITISNINIISPSIVIPMLSLVISFISQLSIISMEFRKEKSPLLKELENRNIDYSKKKKISLFIDIAPTVLAMITLYLITFLTFNPTEVYLTFIIIIITSINTAILAIDALIGSILHIIDTSKNKQKDKANNSIYLIR
jgi:hypothetical protein